MILISDYIRHIFPLFLQGKYSIFSFRTWIINIEILTQSRYLASYLYEYSNMRQYVYFFLCEMDKISVFFTSIYRLPWSLNKFNFFVQEYFSSVFLVLPVYISKSVAFYNPAASNLFTSSALYGKILFYLLWFLGKWGWELRFFIGKLHVTYCPPKTSKVQYLCCNS